MNKVKKQPDLARDGLGGLMLRYSLPCVISLLVAALYNIVDQIFIANATYLGSYGNAANTAVFPLTVIALEAAVMIGDGCCAFVSLRLGGGDKSSAGKGIGNAVTLSVIAGIVIMAVYLCFLSPLVCFFGASVNEETCSMACEYFFWISLGIPFYVFGQAMNPVIRADASPRFAMASTLAGAAVNLILDPIFIFCFRWGMTGAAVATVAGQVLTAFLAVIYLFRTKTVKLGARDFLLHLRTVGRMALLGVCSFLAQISLVAAMAAINNMIRKYGAEDPVFSAPELAQIPMAVVGIVMKFFQIVISIVIGMAAGCIPIVGYNMGAGQRDRVKKLFKMLLFFEALVGLAAFLIAELGPRALISVFGASNESVYYTEFACRAFRIYLSMVILACVNKAAFIFLQAMGKAAESTFISMMRELVLGVGFALILPRFFGLDGVLLSMPASDIVTFVIALVIIIRTFRSLSGSGEGETQKA